MNNVYKGILKLQNDVAETLQAFKQTDSRNSIADECIGSCLKGIEQILLGVSQYVQRSEGFVHDQPASDLSKFRAEQLQDPEFREYYLDNKLSSDIAKMIVGCRLEHNLTQKELADRTGISQADISRLERCEGSPSLKTLKKLARGLGREVKIDFVAAEDLLSDTIQ